ncbi:MAG: alcohol dehydrogenase catalytic domain-containing protein [candidate division WOR-3 bacterium]
MKAAYLTDKGLEVLEVPEPQPSYGELVIKVKAALTDGTDLKAVLRGHPILRRGPFGHEYSGVVHSVGEGVVGFEVGDEVFGVNTAPCFKCTQCVKNRFNLCENLFKNMVLGAYAEYLLIPENVVKINLFKKPEYLPFHIAPIIEPLSCVMRALEKLPFDRFESVLILGSGSISAMFSLVLRSYDKDVLVCGRSEEKLNLFAKHTGVGICKADKLSGKFDLVIDTTASVDVIHRFFEFVNKGGYFLMFAGLERNASITLNPHTLHYNEIQILTSFHHTPISVRKAYNFLLKNHKNFEFLISGYHPLEDIGEAFENLKNGKGFKYAIIP